MENGARVEALCLGFSIKEQAVLSILHTREDEQEKDPRKNRAHALMTTTRGTSRETRYGENRTDQMFTSYEQAARL